MQLTNQLIYEYAVNLTNEFVNKSVELPVKVNFYLQKNLTTLTRLGREIETEKHNIIKKHGEPDKDNPEEYFIPSEKTQIVNEELNELFNLQQEVIIYQVNLNDFKEVSLTTAQMSALMFMIKDEQEDILYDTN